jgi:thiol-disulfide isomerase/thioredoxin
MKISKRISVFLVLVLVLGTFNLGISNAGADYSFAGLVEQINTENLREHVEVLASDRFKGRMVGEEGIQLAEDYIVDQFKEMGLNPAGDDGTYLQHFPVDVWYPKAPLTFNVVDNNGSIKTEFEYRKDYNINVYSGTGKATAPVVFAGFGITSTGDVLEYDDYKGIDAKGKIVAILRHAPTFVQEMFGEHEELYPHMYFTTKIVNAKRHGAVGIVILENPKLPASRQYDLNIKQGSGRDSDMPCLFMSVGGSDKLFAYHDYTSEELFDLIDEKKGPHSFDFEGIEIDLEVNIKYETDVDASNIIGYIPATDPFGVNQTVMITAHYDHVGVDPKGDIYNGACDNASGVSAMLEIARVFTESNARTHTNLAFVAFSAEEIGLVGSRYLAGNPPFPLDGMTVFNMDMVSGNTNIVRCGTEEAHAHLINILKNTCAVLGADYRQFKPAANADHAPFMERGVPYIFFQGSGGMKWHVPEDTIENISVDGIALIAKAVTHATCKLTDPFYLYLDVPGDEKIMATNPTYKLTGYTGRGAMVYVGGRSAIASESGRFSLEIPLVEGDNEITVTANQVGTGDKLVRQLVINFGPRPKLNVSKDMLNFGYVSKDFTPKEISFEVKNTGDGPMDGTITSCADWLKITPNKINPETTTIVARVDISKITESGLNTCMLTLDTTGGIMFIPATVVSSPTPIIEVEIEENTKSAIIAGSKKPIDNEIKEVDTGFLYPASVISMAYGADLSTNGDQKILVLGNHTVRLWAGTNVAVIGNKPVKLESIVYVASDGEYFIPSDLLSKIGVSVSVDEKIHHLSWNAKPATLSISASEKSNTFKISSNRKGLYNIEVDEDWLFCYPDMIDLNNSSEITVGFNTALMTPGEEMKANLTVRCEDTEVSIPVVHSIPTSLKTIEVQIGSKNAFVDGEEFLLDNAPFIYIDTTMVPFRFIGEAFGAEITWVPDTKTVIAMLGKTLVEIQINNPEGKINGIPTKLVRPPMIVEGRTFVPFRFIGEAFGADVEWIPETKGVKVTLDENKTKPIPQLSNRHVSIEWINAREDGVIPREKIEVENIGAGNLTVDSVEVIGDGLSAEIRNGQIELEPVFVETGYKGVNYLIVHTNGGIDVCRVDISIYPQDSVFFECDNTNTWYVNGQIQTDKVVMINGLYATNASKIITAVGGTYGFDSISKEMNIYLGGNNLRLSAETGDFWLNDEFMKWRFGFEIMNESEVYLPWTVLALAFEWEIVDLPYLSAIKMKSNKEKESYLITSKPSIDLVYSESILGNEMTDFVCPTYPLRKDGFYSSTDDKNDYKLYCFFDESDTSSEIIPYIESIHSRFSDSGLKSYLVSAQIPADSEVESYLSGNRIITNYLSDLSLTGITVPIIFDDRGQVCSEFPGVSLPRLYIVDKDNELVFWLPQFENNQVLYLEQAVVSLVEGSGFVPPDVDVINIENQGGRAGSGRLTSSAREIKILSGEFSSSPSSVAVSFNPEEVTWDKKFSSFELTLLGKSNTIHIPVRCWRIESDKTFSSFHDGVNEIRIDGIDKELPTPCLSGDDPVGPIGLILQAIGAEIVYPSSFGVRVIAGDNDVSFEVGKKEALSGGERVEFNQPFTMSGGVLYGPIKFLSEFAGATVIQFDKTTVVIADKVKGSITKPRLKLSSSKIQINEFIPRPGGHRPAIDFELDNYPYSDGSKTKLSDVAARDDVKLIMIDFWATWCPPCKAGIPYMERIHRLYKDKGLAVIGVITDREGVGDEEVLDTLETSTHIQSNLKKLGIDRVTYPMVYDDRPERTAWEAYDGRSIPRLILINSEMEWVHTEVGFWEQGVRGLEYRIRRLLGIEENAKIPEIEITNDGVGTLGGIITCDLEYLKPTISKFSTAGSETFSFTIEGNAPIFPERGFVTIESNGGTRIIPIEYNPFREIIPMEITINTKTSVVDINGTESSIKIDSKIDGNKILVNATELFSILGGNLEVFPDGKRAIGRFEVWEISVAGGRSEILAGLEKFKANAPVLIEGNNVFIEFETICEIIGCYYEPKKGKDQIYLEYQP